MPSVVGHQSVAHDEDEKRICLEDQFVQSVDAAWLDDADSLEPCAECQVQPAVLHVLYDAVASLAQV